MPAVEMSMGVMDLVMLNSNRDHPSVMEMSIEKRDKARKLFSLLVGMSRAQICKDLAHEYGFTVDADEFAWMHNEQAQRLMSLEDSGQSRLSKPDPAVQPMVKQPFGIRPPSLTRHRLLTRCDRIEISTHIVQPPEKLGDHVPKKVSVLSFSPLAIADLPFALKQEYERLGKALHKQSTLLRLVKSDAGEL